MGFKFELEETIERVFSIEQSGKEIISIDEYVGYSLIENEDDTENVKVLFKDVDRKNNLLKRYFFIPKKEIKDFHHYCKYSDEQKFLTMIEKKNKKEKYIDNKTLFIAFNISEKEWEMFCL